MRARIAQATNDLDVAVRNLEAAVTLQDALLPYMEPPYWYYPVRQTLGAVLLLKGNPQGARDAFRRRRTTPGHSMDCSRRTRSSAWATEAREVEKYLMRTWSGDRKRLDLARL